LILFISLNPRIISELLAEMLGTLDNAGVSPQTKENRIPLLLLDGHHSRTRLPFLKYIKNNQHIWKVYIGVPEKNMRQPHNSERNGTFKTCL
jgi:hypothetical protein